MIVDGHEEDPSLCEWGDWSVLTWSGPNASVPIAWIRSCKTCLNEQNSDIHPDTVESLHQDLLKTTTSITNSAVAETEA